MNEIIIGNENFHLMKSLEKNIPIIVTPIEYNEFENYTTKNKFYQFAKNLQIENISKSYSHIELRTILLFQLYLKGLVIVDDIFNVRILTEKKEIVVYSKGKPRILKYDKLLILDSDKVTYDVDTEEYQHLYTVIDKFVSLEKCRRYSVKEKYKIYNFDLHIFVIWESDLSQLEKWECSITNIKKSCGIETGNFISRKMRPKFIKRAINGNDIEYGGL